MKKLSVILALTVCAVLQAQAQTASVIWGAYTSNGIGDATGNPLPNGSNDLVLLGTFKGLTNSQIASMASNETALMSQFTSYGTGVVGDGLPGGPGPASNGYWEDTTLASTNALSIQTLQIYYVVFNAATMGAATQYGIFTDPGNAAWTFPADTAIPNSTITDLSDVPHDATGILYGSFGTGTSLDGASPLYNLKSFTAVPEPSVSLLLISSLGGAGIFANLRRRR